jgi:parallel beta-helix repeat protein
LNDGRNNILYVGGTGEGNYTRIQDAIENASNGDTVFVFNEGSPYYEEVKIDRTINLIGEDKNTTIIDANFSFNPINITADGSLVSGFTVKNCKFSGWWWEFSAIKIYKCKYVKVKNNIITLGAFTYIGGDFIASVNLHSSSNCIIEDNYIYEEYSPSSTLASGLVIHDGSSFNIISGNEIKGYDNGIYLRYSNKNIISNNYLHNNDNGITSFVSNKNDIIGNNIYYNNDYGIELTHSCLNKITDNIISENGGKRCGGEWEGGIAFFTDFDSDFDLLTGSNRNIVSRNQITKNDPTGIIVFDSYNNKFTENNIIDNWGSEGYPQRWWGNAFFLNVVIRIRSLIYANNWNRNYWSDYNLKGTFPKAIKGIIILFPISLIILWLTFDRNPAIEPYILGE